MACTDHAAAQLAQIATLRAQGFVVVPEFLPPERVALLAALARAQLAARRAPLELEADLQYPGAPRSRAAAGGETVRRLLDVYARDPVFAASLTAPAIHAWMAAYFGEPVLMSRAHHNCLMTKHPDYGSLTGVASRFPLLVVRARRSRFRLVRARDRNHRQRRALVRTGIPRDAIFRRVFRCGEVLPVGSCR